MIAQYFVTRVFLAAGAAAFFTIVIGCKGPNAASPPTSPSVDAAKSGGLDPSASEASAALARKTAEYANGMAPLIDQRAASNATSPPVLASAGTTGPPTASTVHWLDPSEIRLSPFPPDQRSSRDDSSPVRPIVDTKPAPAVVETGGPSRPPGANSPAPSASPTSTPPGKSSANANLPASVPEGQDRPSAGPTTSTAGPQLSVDSSDVLERKLATLVKDYPRDIAGHLAYQLLEFVQDRQTPDMAAVAGLPAEDRDIVTTLMDGLANFRDTVRADNNLLLSKKIRPILDMADRLRSQAELTIPTIMLCTKVDAFGIYTAIDSGRFSAGKEHPIIVYCEVENFFSALNSRKMWETRLSQEVVLYTDLGMPVWPEKSTPSAVVDECHNRRHDFFVRDIIRLPAQLTIGRYLLKVTIVDQQSNRVAEATIPIQIVAGQGEMQAASK